MENNRIEIVGSNFEVKLEDLLKWEGRHKAIVYYLFEQKIERVGISIGESLDIVVDHLPVTGKDATAYWPDRYEKDFLVIKGKVLTYWDSLFPRDDLYLLLYLKTGELKVMKYSVESMDGVNPEQYHFVFQDGSGDKWYVRDAYEKTFVIIRSKSNF